MRFLKLKVGLFVKNDMKKLKLRKKYLPETLQILSVESFSVVVKKPPGIPFIQAKADIPIENLILVLR